ncbi:PDZ domain-containing protein [Streptomyces sp. NPDC087300]|uniref:PDZ domain-containing protein n=1 Tax=Streptomyces sp. NPDC087300 TaxID=3365780 RepID=UPI0038107623
MDQTALRPKPMPGQEPDGSGGHGWSSGRRPGRLFGKKRGKRFDRGSGREPDGRSRSGRSTPGHSHRPHAVRRRGRRLTTLFSCLLLAAVLVLSGIGLGTVGATVIGMSRLAEMQRAAPPPGMGAKAGHAPGASSAPAKEQRPTGDKDQRPATPPAQGRAPHHPAALGVEAVDAPGGPGALLIGVHIPGPGYTAGLVRGDTLLAFGGTRVGSAAGLASAVAAARPGKEVTLTVRHEGGGRQRLTVRPGIVT